MGGEVTLAAKPLDCFRMDFKSAAGFDYVKIIIPDRHVLSQ